MGALAALRSSCGNESLLPGFRGSKNALSGVRLLRRSGLQCCIAVMRTFDPERTKAGSKYRSAASPDLVLANPLSLPLHGLGQRMQFGQLKRREFIPHRPSPTPAAVHFGHSSG